MTLSWICGAWALAATTLLVCDYTTTASTWLNNTGAHHALKLAREMSLWRCLDHLAVWAQAGSQAAQSKGEMESRREHRVKLKFSEPDAASASTGKELPVEVRDNHKRDDYVAA